MKDHDFKAALADIRKKVLLHKPATAAKKKNTTNVVSGQKDVGDTGLTDGVDDTVSFSTLLESHGIDTKSIKQTKAVVNKHNEFGNKPKPVAKKITHPSANETLLVEMSKGNFTAEMLTWGESIEYLKDGYSRKMLSKLRRGEYRLDFTVDLHGLFLKEATATIHRLLHTAKANDHQAIRIIHGKGKHSSNKGPVLKSMLNQQLRLRGDVIAFCSAPAHDGGTGVLYCLLDND